MRIQSFIIISAGLLASFTAHADQHFTDFARIIDVSPLHRPYQSEQCRSHSKYPKRNKKTHSSSGYSDSKRHSPQDHSSYYCKPEHKRHKPHKGFSVTYKYRGQIHRTTTKFHPGKRLKIAVHIQPLEY